MNAFMAYTPCAFFVAAATPSESAREELSTELAHAIDCERITVDRVDLKNHSDVFKWREKIMFTHGRTPDIVIASVGKLPVTTIGGLGTVPRCWEEKPEHWARACDDMKGILNVQSVFAGVCHQESDAEILGSWVTLRAPESEAKKSCHIRPRKIVNVTQVIDPPCVNGVAPFRVSLAAIHAATKILAKDFKLEKAEGEVICASIDPGCLPGTMDCTKTSSHKISEQEKYTQFAKAFVPYVLSLQKKDNGKLLTIPGFAGVPSMKT